MLLKYADNQLVEKILRIKSVKKFGEYGLLAYLCSENSLVNENEKIIEQNYYFFYRNNQMTISGERTQPVVEVYKKECL